MKKKEDCFTEACECGHHQKQHAAQFGMVEGHGACTVKGCDCRQYRWKPNDAPEAKEKNGSDSA